MILKIIFFNFKIFHRYIQSRKKKKNPQIESNYYNRPKRSKIEQVRGPPSRILKLSNNKISVKRQVVQTMMYQNQAK